MSSVAVCFSLFYNNCFNVNNYSFVIIILMCT